ncbi:uncharacterized protein LTR77_001550 [Saxophila tyrrhenica]|uniref:Uncharacterized protein n=1 Tax=Saxophila tyrrhenica TaxID=1690608 RepID=A0AAV9PLD4_9PEZI|nr:hypothetical protein LTR77_001550 [Saxophila tyrrhenica]
MANLPIPDLSERFTLAQSLENLHQASEVEQLEFVQLVVQESQSYRGFRHHAASTQRKQDHHLDMYTQWMLFKFKMARADLSDDDLSDLLFPLNDHKRMFEEFRQFLIVVYHKTRPRSSMTGERIMYSTLCTYRDSLMFWTKRTFRMRNQIPPPASAMYYWMTEVMRGVLASYPGAGKSVPKSYLGLPELRQLFDLEMIYNRSIEFCEQHWAAWTIARATACRPGSICASHDARDPGLKWSDLDIRVGDEPGKFALTIRFQNIQIKRAADPEKALGVGDTFLHVYLDSPQPSNLIFSPVHRLLVIALRRGLIEGVESLDDLLKLRRHNITFKESARDQPLFFASPNRGLGIDFSRPLSSASLSAYLKSRAYRAGWVFKVMGFNCIRRRALTDVVSRVGLAAARRLAGHSPETCTLEKYYIYLEPTIDQIGVMTEQPVDARGFSDAHRKRWAPLVMGRIEDERIQRTRGTALRKMTDRLVLADENPPEEYATDPGVRKRYRARLSRIAHQALLQHEQAESKREMTTEEFNRRQQSLEASNFADHVLQRALELRDEQSDAVAVASANDDDDDIEDADQDEDEDEAGQENPEQDLEESGESDDSNVVRVEPEAEMGEEADNSSTQAQDVSYEYMARAFMEVLLDNSYNQYTMWSERIKTCPECQGDETVSEDKKAQEYQSEIHLNNHLEGNFHSAQSTFRRAAAIRRASHPDNLFVCPYCEEAVDDREKFFRAMDAQYPGITTFSEISELFYHISHSNDQTDGPKHDELKELGGWYESDFYPTTSTETTLKARQLSHKNLKAMGVQIIEQRQVIAGAEQYDSFPGIVKGSHDGVPPRFVSSVRSGAPNEIPSKFAGIVVRGLQATQPVPDAFRSNVVSSKAPARRSREMLPPQVSRSGIRVTSAVSAGSEETGRRQDAVMISSGEEDSDEEEADEMEIDG